MPTITAQEALSTIRSSDSMSPEELERLRKERLSRLGSYAREHSPLSGNFTEGSPHSM